MYLLFMTSLPMAEATAMTNKMMNKKVIWVFVTLSMLDLFKGALVEFINNLVSCPAYITTP